jgi:predicted Rossmann fold flavoprotein
LWVTISTSEHYFTENILFTHRGLSGPAVLQLSNYWHEGQSVMVDLLPGDDVYVLLKTYKQDKSRSLLKNLLAKHLPAALVGELEAKFWPDLQDRPIAEIADKKLKSIAAVISSLELKPSGTEGYRTAEVTLGGVDTQMISSTSMECKQQPGLYFIGEVLDVTGHLGGYNFQWAWSSGYVAGLHA